MLRLSLARSFALPALLQHARTAAAAPLTRRRVYGSMAPPPPPTSALKSSATAPKVVVADEPESLNDATRPLRYVWKHIWPADAPDLRRRVVVSLGLLVGAKLLSVGVPGFFKFAVDALTVVPSASAQIALAVPTAALLGYGIARITSSLFNELRSAIFSRVATAGSFVFFFVSPI